MLNICQHKDILYHTVFFSIIDFDIRCVSYSSTMINMYVCFIFNIAIINYSYTVYMCMYECLLFQSIIYNQSLCNSHSISFSYNSSYLFTRVHVIIIHYSSKASHNNEE